MHSHTGCMSLTFLQCVFSSEFSKHLHKKMHRHTGHICLTFPHCVFSNVCSKSLDQSKQTLQSHTSCVCLTFLDCVFSNVSSIDWYRRLHTYKRHLYLPDIFMMSRQKYQIIICNFVRWIFFLPSL